jgi:glycosyltransferase involved in cell wall biosynthesis
MKILMIAPEPLLEARGTPISVYQRLCGLSSLGHEVDLLTYHLGEAVSIPGVRICRIPHVPFIKEVKAGPSWPKLILDVLVFCRALVMLARRRYDVIHSHEEAAFFSIILAALFRTRHVYDMHSSLPRQLASFDFGNYRPIVKLFKILERWAIRTCDAVITVSSDLEQRVREINPSVHHVTIHNLPVGTKNNHIDRYSLGQLRERLGINGRRPIVYTGSFERYQGIGLLIESTELLRRQHPDLLLLLVGGTPEQIEFWKNEAMSRGLGDDVLFIGVVPVAEVQAYTELAEILVSPRTDGPSVPLKIYTYLESGKPIVATDIEAHTNVLNNDTAVLVRPTREDLAAGLARLIENPDFGRQLGLNAKLVVSQNYGIGNYLAKLDRIYQTFDTSAQSTGSPERETTPTMNC